MSDSESESMDVLKEAREILKHSKILKKVMKKICFAEDVELQCWDVKNAEWRTVDKGIRRSYLDDDKKFDAMVPKDFDSTCYRIRFARCEPLMDLEEHFEDENNIPDTVFIVVKLFADKAKIKWQFSMTSRDLGYEETVVLSQMHAVTTGVWLERHDVFPTVAQFEQGVNKCILKLGLTKWLNKVEDIEEDEDDEEEEVEVQKQKHSRSRSRSRSGKKARIDLTLS